MQYKHLNIEEREFIQAELWQKKSIRSIALALNRSPSSITREVNRNIPLQYRYTPRLANERALKKRSCRGRKLRLKSGFIRRYVIDHLKDGYSPEQIAGRLSLEHSKYKISHEAIYQYIYHRVHCDYLRVGYYDLRIYLKRRHKRRETKGMRKYQRVFKPKGFSIDERPTEVETRKVVGHWEGDSMVSRKSRVGLNTLVERKTGLVLISKIQNGTAEETAETVINRLKSFTPKTLTTDNGTENIAYEKIQKRLQISCYFAHPYHSWERGTNENTNGLIRDYFPKRTDFDMISDEELRFVERELNSRPRKRLGGRTPLEAMSGALTC